MGAGAETVILSLSQSNQFIVIRSIPTASYNDQAGVVDTRHGFIFHSPHHTGLLYHALLLHLPLRRLTLHFELCLTDVSPPVAAEGAQPVATIAPSVLNVQQGQRAEFRCTVTGNPTPAIEWIGMTGVSVSCCIISSAEQSCVNLPAGIQKSPLTGGPGNRMSPRAVIRGGVLTFTAVDPADEGDYTCKALNTHGEHTARVSLFVQSTFSVYACVKIYCTL